MNGIYVALFLWNSQLKALYIIITPADQIAFLNIHNFLESMKRDSLLGALIAIILTISFTVLYAGYPYENTWVGSEKSVMSGPGFELGTFCSRVECPNQYTTGSPYRLCFFE